MNYRDFYKSNKDPWKKFYHLIPEGVTVDKFRKGANKEFGEHPQLGRSGAARVAAQHLGDKPTEYDNLKEKELLKGINLDDNCCEEGLPRRADGALDIEHDGRPIRLSKIVQIGGEFSSGKPATGELGGYTAVGGETEGHADSVDSGGLTVKQDGDKEPITAGGKSVESGLASKTVGGEVSPGEGQEQGGPNTKGSIAGTPKIEGGGDEGGVTLSLQEAKSKLHSMVKEALKEITFNKTTSKWERIDEGHKSGCECGFCKNKGTFGKKKKEDEEEVDENVDMKMGPSYKVAPNPTLQTTGEQDLPRIQAYEPEITEMYDEEEEERCESRYAELATAQRNLSENELQELKDLGSKLQERRDATMKMGPSYRTVAPRQARALDDDQAHRDQDTTSCTNEDGGTAVQHSSFRTANDARQLPKNRHKGDIDESEKNDDFRDLERSVRYHKDPHARDKDVAKNFDKMEKDPKYRPFPFGKKKAVSEISDRQITVIRDLAREIKTKYPHLNQKHLEQVIDKIFQQQTGWNADPEAIRNAINQVP